MRHIILVNHINRTQKRTGRWFDLHGYHFSREELLGHKHIEFFTIASKDELKEFATKHLGELSK